MALNGELRADRVAETRSADNRSPPPRKPAPSRGRFSPLTRRILTVNVLALALLVAGLLYLGQYQENLIEAELQALKTQGEIFAGALGQGARGTGAGGNSSLKPELAAPMLRRLVMPTRTRARLFAAAGDLIADSRVLLGPGGAVMIEVLPPPEDGSPLSDLLFGIYLIRRWCENAGNDDYPIDVPFANTGQNPPRSLAGDRRPRPLSGNVIVFLYANDQRAWPAMAGNTTADFGKIDGM